MTDAARDTPRPSMLEEWDMAIQCAKDRAEKAEAALAEVRKVIEDVKRHMATGANSFAYSALNDWLSRHPEQSK